MQSRDREEKHTMKFKGTLIVVYPFVYALQNGASLDYGDCRAKMFDAACPDEGRVCIHGEVTD